MKRARTSGKTPRFASRTFSISYSDTSPPSSPPPPDTSAGGMLLPFIEPSLPEWAATRGIDDYGDRRQTIVDHEGERNGSTSVRTEFCLAQHIVESQCKNFSTWGFFRVLL